jgi:hypothetical protein
MTKRVKVRYIGPFDEVTVPALGTVLKRDQSIEVSGEIAGHPRGDWHPRTDLDDPDWPTRPGADGSTMEVQDPGQGLLAQIDLWQPITEEES